MAKQQLGAYENPIQVIDRDSSKIIDKALNDLSSKAQASMERANDLRSSKLDAARKSEIADQNLINANYEQYVQEVDKNGVKSPDFYALGYDLINRRFSANRAFANAVTPEEKTAARNELAKTTENLSKLTGSIEGLNTMNQETGSILAGRNNNQPNGFYTGAPYDPSKKDIPFDELSFEDKVSRRMHQRRALFENKSGYNMDNGQLFGSDSDGNSFNIATVDGQEIPRIEDWSTDLKADFDKMGILGKDGKMTEEYLLKDKARPGREGNISFQVIPTNMAAAVDKWGSHLKKKAAGRVGGSQGWDDYATNNSTYLAFAGKNAEDLTYTGDYILTDESKIKYSEAMVSYGLKNYLKQYELEDITEVVDENNVEEEQTFKEYQEDDETIGATEFIEGSTPGTFERRTKGIKDKKASKASKGITIEKVYETINVSPEQQARLLNNQFNPNDQKVSYDKDSNVITEIEYQEQTTGTGDDKKTQTVEVATQYYLGEGKPPNDTVSNNRNVKMGTRKQWRTRLFDNIIKGDSQAVMEIKRKFLQDESKVNSGDTAKEKASFYLGVSTNPQ